MPPSALEEGFAVPKRLSERQRHGVSEGRKPFSPPERRCRRFENNRGWQKNIFFDSLAKAVGKADVPQDNTFDGGTLDKYLRNLCRNSNPAGENRKGAGP